MGIPAELELLKHPEPGLRQRHPRRGKAHPHRRGPGRTGLSHEQRHLLRKRGSEDPGEGVGGEMKQKGL